MASDTNLVKELNHIGIETVEQLASTSDADVGKFITGGYQWKKKAQEYVNDNVKSNADVALEKQMQTMKDAHAKEIAELNEKLAHILAAISKPETAEPHEKTRKAPKAE
jgi:uncharacterized protein YicC (UPF0701 family)